MPTTYETVVGMEVHVELSTKTKVFCGCPITFGRPPNTQVCPVCLGLPGSLPVLNKVALEYSIRAALALNCRIARRNQFERKNYYYPDLPKNYQISQLRKNLATGGWLEIAVDEATKRIGIDNVHLEEDAGKSMHSDHAQGDYSLIDLNRAGTPLLEIVSDPDIRSTEEALAYMNGLKNLLQYTGVSDCNMHEGRLRFETNISVRPPGEPLGTKVEVKNLNSMKIVLKCIQFEAARQAEELESGGRIVQETRLWDEDAGVTLPMRSKEEAHDYRYFPEPDLVEVEVDEQWIARLRGELPELPDARRRRFSEQYGLSAYDAGVLTAARPVADYYESAVEAHDDPKAIGNWIMTEVLAIVNREELEIADFPVRPRQLGALLKLIDDKTISGKIAKGVFKDMVAGEGDPAEIVKGKGLGQISDAGVIEKIVDEVIAANPKSAADFSGGKQRALGSLVGQVMKASRGKANPQIVNELLRKKLAD